MSKEEAKTLIEQFKAFGIKAGNHWGPNKTVAGVKIPVKDAEVVLNKLQNGVVAAVEAFMLANTDLSELDVRDELKDAETAEDALTALVRLAASGALNGVVKG